MLPLYASRVTEYLPRLLDLPTYPTFREGIEAVFCAGAVDLP